MSQLIINLIKRINFILEMSKKLGRLRLKQMYKIREKISDRAFSSLHFFHKNWKKTSIGKKPDTRLASEKLQLFNLGKVFMIC